MLGRMMEHLRQFPNSCCKVAIEDDWRLRSTWALWSRLAWTTRIGRKDSLSHWLLSLCLAQFIRSMFGPLARPNYIVHRSNQQATKSATRTYKVASRDDCRQMKRCSTDPNIGDSAPVVRHGIIQSGHYMAHQLDLPLPRSTALRSQLT